MNDISMFLPTPFLFPPIIGTFAGIVGQDQPVPLVSRSLFARVATSHGDILDEYDAFVIVSIRFDICDRVATGPCPVGADGSLRLVFQPLIGTATELFANAGVHAFYAIPAGDVAGVINQLRGLARIAGIPITSPLAARSLLGELPGIRTLVASLAKPERLIRLTAMGQDRRTPDLRVVFRGLELQAGQMVDIDIPTLGATEQVVTLEDVDPSYRVTPVVDVPAGFATTLTSGVFNAASPADQRSALEALVATQNPTLHTMSTVQCIACHVSTYLGVHRGAVSGIDLRTLTNHFETDHDVRISGGVAGTQERGLHAFSWLNQDKLLSQRVANETALVLDEIEQRFPAPHP